METILFISSTEQDGSLAKPALEALSLAISVSSQLKADLMVGLMGESVQNGADQVQGCGAQRFLGVAGADFGSSRYVSDAAAMEALAKASKATIVIVPATSRLNRVISGVTARLQGRSDTHVTGISINGDKTTVTRWYYRQRMEAQLQRNQRPWFISVDPGCFSPWESPSGSASVEYVSVNGLTPRTQVSGIQAPPSDEQTIRPDANLLFVAGAGWTKKQSDGQPHVKDAERLILDFLRNSRASLGSSKSLVDQGGEGQDVLSFLTHLNQIGQTGSTPRHQKGLATCCHGEEPHTVGWRFINERRAINLDPNCGWARGKADVLYVADAFQVMTQVNALLAGK